MSVYILTQQTHNRNSSLRVRVFRSDFVWGGGGRGFCPVPALWGFPVVPFKNGTPLLVSPLPKCFVGYFKPRSMSPYITFVQIQEPFL